MADATRKGLIRRVTEILLATFGVVCMLIALAHIGLGPRSIPGSVPVNALMDSEDRFYATLFLGFGAATTWASRDLDRRSNLLAALLVVFFLGGVARLVSWAQVGPPSPLFVFLGGLELALPPLFWALTRASVRRPG